MSPCLSPKDERAVARYAPRLPPEVWAAVGDFVRAAVSDCAVGGLRPTGAMLHVSCRLAVWVWASGLPLEREAVFDRHAVGLFIDRGCEGTTKKTRGSYRSLLLRMGRFLAPAQHPARLPRLGPGPVSAPYSAAEQAALRSWARGWRTKYRREQSALLLALGFGAGLTRVDIADLLVGHVTVDSGGVLVDVRGERGPRIVPVLRDWEEAIADAVNAARDPDQYLLSPRATKSRLHIVSNPGHSYSAGAPSTGRMRATWIVTQLAAGIPTRALLDAAGVSYLDAFDRYVQFLPGSDPVAARRLLRGKTSES